MRAVSSSETPVTHPRHPWPRALAVTVAGMLLITAAWALFAMATGYESSWLAVPVAWMIAHSLVFWSVPRGTARTVVAVVLCGVALVLARWWIAAGLIGQAAGAAPMDAVMKTGLWFVGYLNAKSLNAVDVMFFALALGVGAWHAARATPRLSTQAAVTR